MNCSFQAETVFVSSVGMGQAYHLGASTILLDSWAERSETSVRPDWWNGIHRDFKNLRRKACWFDSSIGHRMGRKAGVSKAFYEIVKENLKKDAKKTPQTLKQLAEKHALTLEQIRRILSTNSIFYIKEYSTGRTVALEPRYTDHARWHGLADRVKEIRLENKLTQNQFNAKAKSSIRCIEVGQCDVSVSVVEKIAIAFNVSPAWLAFGLGAKRAKK